MKISKAIIIIGNTISTSNSLLAIICWLFKSVSIYFTLMALLFTVFVFFGFSVWIAGWLIEKEENKNE